MFHILTEFGTQWEKYKEYNEHEKEELRLQIHDLEQLLEEERQTFEENRKSVSPLSNVFKLGNITPVADNSPFA